MATQVISIRTDSVVDSSLAVALRQARERSYRAATQVDTIVVHPDTLKLRIGQSVEPFSSLTIEARTTDGKRVEHFAPLFEVGDRTIAEFAGPGIQGRKVGLTWLVISAFTGGEADRRIFASSIVWIRVYKDSASYVPSAGTIDTTPQDPHAQLDRGGYYIDSVFRSTLGQSPRMGWFLSGRFLAAEHHSRVYVFSADSVIRAAEFQEILTPVQHDSIARREHLACDSEGPLAAYQLLSAGNPLGARAFFTSRLPPAPIWAHAQPKVLTGAQQSAIRELLALDHSSVVYLDTAITTPSGRFFYSFNAAYDSSTHALIKSALILHDSAGHVLAHEVVQAEAFACDGCGEPTLEDGIGPLYALLNAFEIPGFAYPVLLLDTGTVEGRALSLVTFTPSGQYTEYRVYEYVVTCIIG